MNLRGLFTSLLFVFSFLGFSSQGQQARIFGVVKDSLNKPVFGATVAVFGKPIGITTSDNGNYTLFVPANEPLKIVFSFTGLRADTVFIKLNPGEERNIDRKLKDRVVEIGTVDIEERSMKSLNLTKIDPKVVSVIPTPNQSVEDLIKTLPGVVSANELSSSYSVRGGNYDENLVYVNDCVVYRTLLVRSGQQEGLSIINPDMVESIQFSAGGFDAVYGDKLSSVLDIKYRKPNKFGNINR